MYSHSIDALRCLAQMAAVLACIPGIAAAQRPSLKPMPDSVRRYVDEAVDLLHRESLHQDEVNWAALRDSVLARSAGAQRTDETWRALQWALRRVDEHSFLQTPRPMPPERATAANSRPSERRPVEIPRPVGGRVINGRFGYVLVPWFTGAMGVSPFADSLQAAIRSADSARVCGWVVDLRHNDGGNMWPMLAGIGPLLGDTIVGSFVERGKPGQLWRYMNGAAWAGGPTVTNDAARVSGQGYRVRDPLAPIALLADSVTASSGEAVFVAFRGRPNVRAFGDTTRGYTSVNHGYKLADGANMVITIGYDRDRTGLQYPLRIGPDELVRRSPDASYDAALARAVEWLGTQPACRSQATGRARGPEEALEIHEAQQIKDTLTGRQIKALSR